ncbi:LuxR C-terminal-related transcriptional regulator [Actinocorallia sp. A-T 12471]|uniref:LuxR C-terminal-related transcriptional regulator n=1 Tax=Actinocorallia sp. A-T 12471 TaxID=3089813 RepID=UPI0029D1921D|nr:LuxR C-terminal-related transcriptional regulator [Actinocorallia sp. A-T 12471]MDX6739606.1 LuxR C-terminal-related transcriptional regulator [Actinocorallia sp. A-T 12471]
MRGHWPFAGRAALLGEIGELVRAPGGAVLTGDAGVGKSRLAAEAVGLLPPGRFRVLRVGATRAAARLPFGAFGHLLPVPDVRTLPNPLRWAEEAITGDGGALLLVVDDAHLLDPASAALVLHLVARRGHRVLATLREGEPVPDAVRALWKEGPCSLVPVAPLTLEESAEILRGALGGPVRYFTAARLWRTAGGNALFLRELVEAGTAAGRLAEHAGVWRWDGDPPMTPRLQDLIRHRAGEVPADEREVLRLVALGEPLAAETLARLTSDAAVERAVARGLVRLRSDGRRIDACLGHPLYGDLARSEASPLLIRRTLTTLAATVEATGMRRAADRFQVAVWRLESGAPQDPGGAVDACLRATAAYDLGLAERLARAALAAGGGHGAAVALARVLYLTGRGAEADVLLSARTGGDDAEIVELATMRAFGNGLTGFSVVDPLTVLDAAAEAVASPEIAGMRAWISAQRGDFARARATLAGQEAPLTGRAGAYASVARAILAAYTEDAAATEAVAEAAFASYDGWGAIADAEMSVQCARLVGRLGTGDVPGALAVTDGMTRRFEARFAGWDLGVAGFLGHRAQALRLLGRTREALEAAREGAARLADGKAGFAGLCLGELAHAAALLELRKEAEPALAAAVERGAPGFELIDFPARLAAIWAPALDGDGSGAVETALACAEEAERRGLGGYLVFALHDVVRLGRAALVADRLAGLAGRMGGALAALCAEHATGAAAGDAVAMERAARGFQEAGMLLYAAEAEAHAAAAHERAGAVRAARAARARGWRLAARCQGARTPALVGLAFPELTARQREVAGLAASGLSNREIANLLHTSVRTVSNHLVAVYARLGVSDRADLADMLAP